MDKEELVAQIQMEIDRATKNCKKCIHIDVCMYYPREQCEHRTDRGSKSKQKGDK